MAKYYVVGLKNGQVAAGALSQIADVIRTEFLETSKAVLERRLTNPVKKWAVIHFESDFLLDTGPNPYPDYDEVLYLNGVAKEVFDRKGIQLNFIDELDNLPGKELGMFISMPVFD